MSKALKIILIVGIGTTAVVFGQAYLKAHQPSPHEAACRRAAKYHLLHKGPLDELTADDVTCSLAIQEK
ncbi:MAG: hypothetical protein QFB87_02985 [Patescibacteria group bacterium]|nr:hypothetical protein [Patescibacteria group bacterium]